LSRGNRDEPIFPATEVRSGPDQRFEAVGPARKHWSNATPTRKIFKEDSPERLALFRPAQLSGYPRPVRTTDLPNAGAVQSRSQNLGHESPLTTFASYGAIDLKGAIDVADFNDSDKLGSGKEMVDRLSSLVAIFNRPEFDFRDNRAEGDDLLATEAVRESPFQRTSSRPLAKAYGAT
jgi:hypothetical protein